jgi:hypothetical protein
MSGQQTMTTAGMTLLGSDGTSYDETNSRYYGGRDGRLYSSQWGRVTEVDPIETLHGLCQRVAQGEAYLARMEASHDEQIALWQEELKATGRMTYARPPEAWQVIPGDYERVRAARKVMLAVKAFVEGGTQ